LFSDIRSFEALEQLHLGMLSSIEGKTLPAIAEVFGLANE
jgi:SRSO17 transposase